MRIKIIDSRSFDRAYHLYLKEVVYPIHLRLSFSTLDTWIYSAVDTECGAYEESNMIGLVPVPIPASTPFAFDEDIASCKPKLGLDMH